MIKRLTLEEFKALAPCKTYRNDADIAHLFENGKTKNIDDVELPVEDRLWYLLRINEGVGEKLKPSFISQLPEHEASLREGLSAKPAHKVAATVISYCVRRLNADRAEITESLLREVETAIG